MEKKKFNGIFAYIVGVFMVLSFCYILFLLRPKKVSNYKPTKNITYKGQILKNKLNGKGELICPDGKYLGGFKDSRFDGKGKFIFDDFVYYAKFNKDKANKDIKIKHSDGYTYKRVKKGWMRLEGKDEN